MKNIVYFFFFLLGVLTVPCFSTQAAEMVGFDVDNGQETITISVPSVSPHKVFLVPRPDRLVVDVPPVGAHSKVALPDSYNGDLIKKLRYGRFDKETSRFVFDLNHPIHVKDVREENARNGDLLIITIVAAEKAEKTGMKISHHAALKHKRPIIIIDPGHGGVDPGTIGPDGTQEKDVVLEFAKALKARLLRTGHYEVELTRDDDTFIMLRKRVDIARKDHGDIFISLHADSAPEEDLRGLSVYTVSEQASDKEAEALATSENKADVLSGVDLEDERKDVAGILISLAERDTKNRSATLADELVASLDDKVELLENSHRFAGFAVLKAPDIPSVLIETGFLSNPKEEKLLNSKMYRDKVVSGIVAGVDKYFKLEKVQGGE